MYELKQGSIFDEKCDIVIIPCNDSGGLSAPIRKDLISYGLPTSVKACEPGQVIFEICPRHFTLSSVIGYSASVELLSVWQQFSTSELLHNICNQIIAYCRENSLRIVNIPLLGAGAGKLSYEESFRTIRDCFKTEPYMKANIYALSENVYRLLKASESPNQSEPLNKGDSPSETTPELHPRVFISYTGYNENNRNWVKNLCLNLRRNGVDARCDIYHLKLGQDLPQWMTNEIFLANKVLLICDKYYLSKIDSHRGGVSWETMIIQGDMLMNQDINKYICIMREENPESSLPIYMRTKYSLRCVEETIDDELFRQLLFSIFDCEDIPPVLPVPQFIKDKLVTQ